MKSKKIIMFFFIIISIFFIVYIGYYLINNTINKKNNKIKEYIPPEEISQDQLRKTNIILFYEDIKTGELKEEIKQIDSKNLIENPEIFVINLLLEGPKDTDNYKKIIPQGAYLLGTKYDNGILFINFSEELSEINNMEENKKILIINSIIKTISQLNEINKIIIQINGINYYSNI